MPYLLAACALMVLVVGGMLGAEWAVMRIRGAVDDELREDYEAPDSERAKAMRGE